MVDITRPEKTVRWLGLVAHVRLPPSAERVKD